MISKFSKWSGWLALSLLALAPSSYSGIRNKVDDTSGPQATAGRAETNTGETVVSDDVDTSPNEMIGTETPLPKPAAKSSPKRIDQANAFVAGPDWEFDGFVSGGQDSNIRSMFYLNDLIYLNIGAQHGIAIGDKVGIYKRGDKIRDPQTGKFIGYEVRRAAIAKVTDRVDEETSAVRISQTIEPVEIGDLVRREQ